MIRSFRDQVPDVAESAYVDPAATVIGCVTIEANATILPGAVLRGDGGGQIMLRKGANVQDNAMLHADAPDERVVMHENAAVGHNAIVHNAEVGEHSLVGMHATVLDHASIEDYSIVAANSLVLEGQEVSSCTLVGGSPAEVIQEDLSRDDDWFRTAKHYTELVEGLRSGEEIKDEQ